MKHIDLNCDMGESFGAWSMGDDVGVMPWVSSVNIACGFHAGDPVTMQRTLEHAAAANVAVGAHVSLPDLAGFGRRRMAVTPEELYAMTVVQLGALNAMARRTELTPTHVKPHGALYHMLEEDTALAQALVEAVRDVDASLRVVGLAGGVLVATAAASGLVASGEAFADRRYADGRHLQPRSQPDAVIAEPDQAVEQAVSLAIHGTVSDAQDRRCQVQADTICVHGDRPDAATFARALHEGLQAKGVRIQAPDRSLHPVTSRR